jgi:hypothetical protein
MRFRELILLQPEIELSACEAETLGGPRPVPATLARDLRDGLALDRAEVGGDRTWRLARGFQCEVLRPNEPSFAKNGRPLERVAELADVAWRMGLSLRFDELLVRHRKPDVNRNPTCQRQIALFERSRWWRRSETSGPYSLKYYQFDSPGCSRPSGSASALCCSDGYIDESCAPSRRRT